MSEVQLIDSTLESTFEPTPLEPTLEPMSLELEPTLEPTTIESAMRRLEPEPKTVTQLKLKEWAEIIKVTEQGNEPGAPEYWILHCSMEGCDSYQLNDVFCQIETLNCKNVDVHEILGGRAVLLCDKHKIRLAEDTKSKLKEWDEIIKMTDQGNEPGAPEYRYFRCDIKGCDSYQLNNVFCQVATLNCESVETALVNGKVLHLCNKHK